MFELKPISKEAIPRALAKAERYRLLNEPRESQSICRDVLAADPENQEALVALVLATTDLFSGLHARADEVRPHVARIKNTYERAYYAGVVEERWAKALMLAEYPKATVYEVLRSGMEHFAAADRVAPEGNDDAVLRWNTCVRLIDQHGLAPTEEPAGSAGGVDDEDVPAR